MCGRFVLVTTPEKVSAKFLAPQPEMLVSRYNISPTQPVVMLREPRETKKRELAFALWGLIPAWAKDLTIGSKMFNARSETAVEKPAFRAAMRYRRCVIPATGFYEWKKEGTSKSPYLFRQVEEDMFGFAGLWETWTSDDGSSIDSCSILTTTPNELLSEYHDRMPVILNPEQYDDWMDSTNTTAMSVKHFLKPFPADKMTAYKVSPLVGNPRNDGPELIKPAY